MATVSLNPAILEQMQAMTARKRRGASGTGDATPKGNLEQKLVGLLTQCDKHGVVTLQAETVLEGWTQVDHGQVLPNVRPEQVAGRIRRRSEEAVEKAIAGVAMTAEDARYAQYKVLPSVSLRPSPQAKLGGRFYIVSNDEDAANAATKAQWNAMLDDVEDEDSVIVSTWRTADLKQQ